MASIAEATAVAESLIVNDPAASSVDWFARKFATVTEEDPVDAVPCVIAIETGKEEALTPDAFFDSAENVCVPFVSWLDVNDQAPPDVVVVDPSCVDPSNIKTVAPDVPVDP
jgi:hypothetical protein